MSPGSSIRVTEEVEEAWREFSLRFNLIWMTYQHAHSFCTAVAVKKQTIVLSCLLGSITGSLEWILHQGNIQK